MSGDGRVEGGAGVGDFDEAGALLVALSTWIDDENAGKDAERMVWVRCAKVAEEAGEVVEAVIGMLGENPRKGVTHSEADVIDELLDVAVTALGAVEHLMGNRGFALDRLVGKIRSVAARAGVTA